MDECLDITDTLEKDLLISLRQAVEADGGGMICEGEALQLSATDLAGATYLWQGPNEYISDEQFPNLEDVASQNTGTYQVVGTISGCATFPAFIDLDVISKPIPDLGPDTLFCAQNGLSFELSPGNFVTYRWQDNTTTPTYSVLSPGVFNVSVTNDFGCVGVDSVQLEEQCPTVALFPNVFSPNGDGVNDFFEVKGNDIIAMTLIIYDRWGNLIYETNDFTQGWDGRWREQDAPNGVYVWMIQLEGFNEDGTTFSRVDSGTVTLVR